MVAERPTVHHIPREWCKSAIARLALSEISIPERSERVFLRELMDGGRRRVRAHGALNGRVREIAVDEGRGQAANSRAASMPPIPNAGTPGTPDARSLSRPPAAPKLRFAPNVERSPKSPKFDEAFRRAIVPVADACASRAEA